MKFKIASICFALIVFCKLANAHNFWIDGENEDKFKAFIGYGEHFSRYELIAKDHLGLFKSPYIIKKDGTKIELKQDGANYEFSGEKLYGSSYILASEYESSFWSVDENAVMHIGKSRADLKNAKDCRFRSMFAKNILSIDDVKDEFVKNPIGHELEFVPISDPFEIKAEEPFKLLLLLNGKPLKRTEVRGVIDGFLSEKYAFYGKTDLKGVIDIIALKPGKWVFKATYNTPYDRPEICDTKSLVATIIVNVK